MKNRNVQRREAAMHIARPDRRVLEYKGVLHVYSAFGLLCIGHPGLHDIE